MPGHPGPPESAFNHRYFAGIAAKSAGSILDYGCGRGQIVALGLARGLDIWGADTFSDHFETLAQEIDPRAAGRIGRIVDGRAEYPSAHFDLVLANQVLEHVEDLDSVIADIHRLLRPGGWFVAAFPVLETWYEGHVGFYFAHRFRSRRLRRSYLSLGHRLGFGLYRKFPSRERWLSYFEDVLDRACFYRPRQQIVTALEKAFGAAVSDLAADYMRTRLGAASHHLPGFADPLLRFVYRRRAGELIRVQKRPFG